MTDVARRRFETGTYPHDGPDMLVRVEAAGCLCPRCGTTMDALDRTIIHIVEPWQVWTDWKCRDAARCSLDVYARYQDDWDPPGPGMNYRTVVTRRPWSIRDFHASRQSYFAVAEESS